MRWRWARTPASPDRPHTQRLKDLQLRGYEVSSRVSIATLIATRPGTGGRASLIYRTHVDRGYGKHPRKAFTEANYARLLDGAHQELAGPIVLV